MPVVKSQIGHYSKSRACCARLSVQNGRRKTVPVRSGRPKTVQYSTCITSLLLRYSCTLTVDSKSS